MRMCVRIAHTPTRHEETEMPEAPKSEFWRDLQPIARNGRGPAAPEEAEDAHATALRPKKRSP